MIKQLTVIIINIDEEDSEGLIIIPWQGEKVFLLEGNDGSLVLVTRDLS